MLVRVLEQHGLGVAIAAAIGFVAWYLLRHLMSNHKEDRKTWKESLDAQQVLITNHLTHLDKSNAIICQSIERHDQSSKHNSEAIVKAIESQTEVLRVLHEAPPRRR
jgi:hypothetical protein